MKRRVEKLAFLLAVAAGTLWAYSKIHTYATGQDPRIYLVLAKGLLEGGGRMNEGLVVPGWPLVLAGVAKVFGIHAAFWTNVPLFALLAVVLAKLAGRLAGSAAKGMLIAAGAALLMLGGYEHNPHFLLWVFRQTPVYLTGALALLCTVRAAEKRAAGRRGAASGWFFGSLAWVGAGVALRETGVLLLPVMGLYWLADALGWVGAEGASGRGKGRWLLVGLFAGIGAAGALAVVTACLTGLAGASAQVGYLLDWIPYLFCVPRDALRTMAGWIPEELGVAGCAALAVGAGMSVRRKYRGFLLLFLVAAAEQLLFDGFIKAHRRFFLSTLFYLAPVAMLGAVGVAGAVRNGVRRIAGRLRDRRARLAGWCVAWVAMAGWCASVVGGIGPWGVRATRGDVERALAAMEPWIEEGRPLLVDARARFLEDVLAVFTDWSVLAVDADNAEECVQESPRAFVRPENGSAVHWAVPGASAERLLERYGRVAEAEGGERFALGKSEYRVMRVERWTATNAVCRLPAPPSSGMVPPPSRTLLRLEAPECASETDIRVWLGGRLLAERLEPGVQFLAVPAEWLEGAGEDGVELRLESDGAIPEDFRPRWMHPDAPLEMEFGVAVVPSCASYLSEEFRAFDGLRGLDAVFPYWPAPVQAREFAGDGTIRLPEGAGEDGAEYVVWLSVAPVCGERVGRMEVSVSLPEYPEAGTARAEMDHRERLTTLEFGFGRLPRSPRALRVHVEHDIPVREELLGNPRYHNVQIGELRLFARREVDSLEVRVGAEEDGMLLGDGFFRREHSRTAEHGRWTGARAEVYLPLRGGRDCRLELDYSQLRPEGAGGAVPKAYLNGHLLDTETTESGLAARLPSEWLKGEGEGTNLLAIESETWCPADFGAGDDRQLGIFLRNIRAGGI